jgi:PIN domain nuclease of toxin-antitoxin system
VTGTTLDAGALIALESGSPYMRELIRLAIANSAPLAIPAGVLAQVWRASARQARVARLLGSPLVEVVPLDRSAAVAVGKLCAQTGARDVVDVSVVLCAKQRRHTVITSDPGDLREIDAELRLLDPVTGHTGLI